MLYTPNANTVWYYPLDWNSNSGSTGGINWTDTNVTYVDGKFWQAWSYNGSSSRTFINSSLWIDWWPITISCWVKMNAEISSSLWRFVVNSNNNNDVLYNIYYDYNWWTRRLAFDRTKNTVASNPAFYTITLWTTNWYNLILTYEWTVVTWYINWVWIWTNTASTGNWINWANEVQNVTTIWDLYYWWTPSHIQFINATIDEVIIENVWWTAKKVSDYYNYTVGKFDPIIV